MMNPKWFHVFCLTASALLSAELICQSPAQAQAAKSGGVDRILTTRDNFPLHITYFEASTGGKEAAVAILLPAAEGADAKDARTRRVWDKTAALLQKSGFAVVSVDLRKHGDSVLPAESTTPAAAKVSGNDYTAMAAIDLEAVKEFLLLEHQNEKLNIRKTGIVAAGSSAMIASAFAVADWDKKPFPDAPTLDLRTPRGQDVRSLMMISPRTTVKGINGVAALKIIKALDIRVFVLASKKDEKDAEKVFKAVELKGEQYAEFRKMTITNVEARAEQFVEGPEAAKTNELILEFMKKSVQELDMPWRTRKSNL
ncbi:MAG: hypothetical protein JNL58_24040 [Planctomyces sp.]|nr:hypothetical protein [Planctomyces sp.]